MPDTVVTVSGNLTADAEIRFTQSGASVCNFTVASTPRTYNSSTKEYEDGETIFWKVVAWKNLADGAAELGKGTAVMVTGKVQQKSYTTREGDKRTYLEITADDIGKSVRVRGQSQARRAPADDPWGRGSDEPPF